MESFSNESFWSEKKIRFLVCYSLAFFVFFPLGMIKTFSQMKFVTIFGFFSVLLNIFIVVIQFFGLYYHNVIEKKMEINFFDFSQGIGPDLKFVTSISTIIYSYECHAGIFPIISNLINPTEERVDRVFKKSTIINTVLYITIALTGYLSQPQNTPDLILEREKISHNDYFMIFGLFLFSITLMTKIGVLFNILRGLLLNIMKYNLNNYPIYINIFIIIIVFSITTFMAATFQNISDYISIISSFYGLFIAIIIPGIIYIKDNDIPMTKKFFTFIFIVVFCSIGTVSIYYTLKKIFKF